MTLKQQIKSRYNAIASRYDKLEFLLEFFFLKRLRAKFLPLAQGSILETSVGTGKNLPFYPPHSQITATDLSEKMLEVAKNKSLSLPLKINFLVADTESLPFKSNSFDTVVNSLSLCTYPSPRQALKKISRVCKPKGQLLFLEHGISSNHFIAFLQNIYKRHHYKKFFCHLTRDPISLIKKADLKIIHQERFFFGIFYLIIAKQNR